MGKKRRIMVKRLTVILLFLLAAFAVLLGRVAYYKYVYGEEYETVAKTQQVNRYDTIISPNRGTIVDRNKYALAVSTTVYNIVLDVRVLVEFEMAEQEKTLNALSEVLGLDYSTLKGYTLIDPATGKPALDTNWKVLKKSVTKEVKEELEAKGLKGVVYEKDTQRSYPTGKTAAQTIGFTRNVRWGIENYYNKYMEGTPGRSFITYDVNGEVNALEMDAQDGYTVVTTLDYIIQQYAEAAVSEAMEAYNPENAAVMVMDPSTGEVLAMAQGPTFDPNDPANPVYMDNEEFAESWELKSDEENDLIDRIAQGDNTAREPLIVHNLRLVVYIAQKFDNTGVSQEDLVSIGTIGLIKAVNTFCPDKNIKLATYASRCISNEILMYLRKNGNLRNEISLDEPLNTDWDGNELHFSDVLTDPVQNLGSDLENEDDIHLLMQCVEKLPAREKEIITLRFGLFGNKEYTQKEVADLMGISQSYISRLEKKILKRLKKEIEKEDI